MSGFKSPLYKDKGNFGRSASKNNKYFSHSQASKQSTDVDMSPGPHSAEKYDAGEAGSACEVDGVHGRCVPPHRCLSTNPYIEGLVPPPNCTGDEAAKLSVCCTDCDLVANASEAVMDGRGSYFWKSGEKSWDKCIEWMQRLEYPCHYRSWAVRLLIEKSVVETNTTATDAPPSEANNTRKCHMYGTAGVAPVGGEDVERGEFPHMVLLGYRDSQVPTDWLCSGALVSERFVLTAAHCLASSLLGPVTEVAVGLLKRSDPVQYWHRYKVARVIPYPDYHPPSKYHDIALLETDKPVQFVKDVRPACLPAHVQPADYADTDDITATGWGGLGRRLDLADTMQRVHLQPFSETECEALYPAHRHLRKGINHFEQMCYGHYELVRDTCGGDSGGPLQLDTWHPSCVATVLGVTSFGHECGTAPSAGVYTRVQNYLPWIESIVWA